MGTVLKTVVSMAVISVVCKVIARNCFETKAANK